MLPGGMQRAAIENVESGVSDTERKLFVELNPESSPRISLHGLHILTHSSYETRSTGQFLTKILSK